jgi:hypothetical protein
MRTLQKDLSSSLLQNKNHRSTSKKSDYTEKIKLFYNNRSISTGKSESQMSRNQINNLIKTL